MPQIYVGVDSGVILRDAGQKVSSQLSGAVVGLRMIGGHLSSEVSYEMPLQEPSFLNAPKQGFMRFRLGLNVRF